MNPVATNTRGFSLAEVTIALGLVAFCLIALVGLLPVGLDLVRDSAEEAATVNCMEQIVESLREASPEQGTPGTYRAAGAYSESLEWTLGGPRVEVDLNRLAPGGFPEATSQGPFYKARIEIIPPPNLTSTGAALVAIAWPAEARWDPTKKAWINAQGSVSTWVVFVPRP